MQKDIYPGVIKILILPLVIFICCQMGNVPPPPRRLGSDRKKQELGRILPRNVKCQAVLFI